MTRKTVVVIVLAAAAILGLAAAMFLHETPIDRAKAAMRARLKDPESAIFRNVEMIEIESGLEVVCGEVNAKNAFGGYVGFHRFAVAAGGAVVDTDQDTFDLYAGWCSFPK